MHVGRTVFSQLMDFVPRHTFRQIVERHKGDRRVRRFSCWDQFLTMAFAQLTYRESLRDIDACLGSLGTARYHAGMRTRAARSTLADANDHRPWQMYQELAEVLIAQARLLYQDELLAKELRDAVYALDATIIELCLKLFPWAKAHNYIKTRAGVKLHTQLDVRANIPVFAMVSVANMNERLFLDHLVFQPGAFYIMDRGYMDFFRLKKIDSAGAFFLIRAKRDLNFVRILSHPVDKAWGVRVDQTIRLGVPLSLEYYPDCIRRIKLFDHTTDKSIVVLTNNFLLDGLTIGHLYRSRWRVELFFKWIKQHLRIKAFYGTSLNAVNTQIWIALAIFVLVAIVKKRLKLDTSLYNILQILSVSLFQKDPINQVLSSQRTLISDYDDPNQLKFFDF
jgi:hypothetical protein